MRKIVFYSLLLFSITVAAQHKTAIVFAENEHNFGTICENGGKVSHRFVFSNNGLEPISIQSVTASCGCTTSEWTPDAIAPEQQGSVLVTFDPYDRVGAFHKAARVVFSTTSGNVVETLDIMGDVVPCAAEINQFVNRFGALGVESTLVDFATIYKDSVPFGEWRIINNIDEPLRLSFSANDYVVLDAPAILKPSAECAVEVRLLTDKCPKWGDLEEHIAVYANGKQVVTLILRAKIVENFENLTLEQRIAAPIAVIAQKTIDLGEVAMGSKASTTIELENSGIEKLLVRAVNSECDYVHATAAKTELKSGKKTKIKIEVDATQLQLYSFSKNLCVITNDPTNPVQTICVKWRTVPKK